MSPVGWVGVGVGGTLVASLIIALVAESEARQAVKDFAMLLAALPFMLVRPLRNLPRGHRLSAKALETFARQRGSGMGRAWAFTYRGRGVIVFHRNEKRSWWRNDAPMRMADAVEAGRSDAGRGGSR